MAHRPPPRLLSLAFVACVGVAWSCAQSARAQVTTDPIYADEIAQLAAHPQIGMAFRAIRDWDRWALERLIEITEIPAPPFMEEARGRRFAELLTEHGIDSVWTDEVGNIVGLRRGRTGGRTIAIGGHLDTVFPQWTDVTVRQRGDTLFAPGIGDDARGLVVVLSVLRALEHAEIETDRDLMFVGVVGEEGLGDLRGMKHIYRNVDQAPAAWIEVDGGGLAGLVTMGLGSVRYRATFQGPGGHSWGAFGLVNPAHALGRAIRHFQDAADSLTRHGPRTSYNVGRIGGGTSVNSIPASSWMEVDMRSVEPESLAAIEAVFVEAMDRALAEENALRRRGEALTLENLKIGDRPSGEGDPTAPLLQRAVAATVHFGVEPQFERSSTNSNVPIALGIPSVTIGRGGIGFGAHSLDEYWINVDGHLAIQRALLLAVAEAGLADVVP